MDLDVKEKRLQRLLIGLIISFISMFIVLIFANFLFFFVIEQVLLYSIRLLKLSFLFHRVGAVVIEELVTRLVELELLSRRFFFISCIFVFFASGHVRDVSSVELTGFC